MPQIKRTLKTLILEFEKEKYLYKLLKTLRFSVTITEREFKERDLMNIALIAHDSKKELMTQFCIAYCGTLSKHSLCATGTTGKMVSEATGLEITRFLCGYQGGDEQIASRIACNEIDLLLLFRDPLTAKSSEPNEANLLRLCDVHNIPVATNLATAEALIHALERGDLDWRDIVNPKRY
jgi:methylglyoxal synthase